MRIKLVFKIRILLIKPDNTYYLTLVYNNK